MTYLFKSSKKLKIKICGLSLLEDIQICTELGVDALGFLVKATKQSNNTDILLEDEAKELISYMQSGVKSVLLIKFSDIHQIISMIKNIKPDVIQIQKEANGLEIAKELRILFPDIEIIKTLYTIKNIAREELYDSIDEYAPYVDAINLDSEEGGSGKKHDWNMSTDICQYVKRKKINFILSGGLNAGNLEEAYCRVKPNMMDIMTGVRLEGRLGKKDSQKIKEVMKVINHINNNYEIHE